MLFLLPEEDIVKSIKCLDYTVLDQTIVSTTKLMKILAGNKAEPRMAERPYVAMWRYYPGWLADYLRCMHINWRHRFGVTHRIYKLSHSYYGSLFPEQVEELYPYWLGDEKLHKSHQAWLLRKNYLYYAQHGWDVDVDTPEYWPEMPVLGAANIPMNKQCYARSSTPYMPRIHNILYGYKSLTHTPETVPDP